MKIYFYYDRNPPKEGNVYCKVCGEFICTDEFSIFEGFSDGIPTRTNEKIRTKKFKKKF